MRYYYAYDLYPSNDPKDGARIRRLASLQSAGANSATSGTFYQAAAKGTGSGQIMVRGTTADAGDIDPDGLQYIRVRRVDTGVSDGATLSGYDEKVVGGFFLDSGDFDAITEANTKQLTFGGAGALSVLDREFMWSHTYVGAAGELSTKSGGQDPFDRIWRLFNQGDFAGGDHLGAVLWRAMAEGLSYQDGAYTHKHGDGTVHTDTHADDKTESAISMVTLTFDGFTDSDGNDWTLPSGNFTADVGESLLSVVRRLMEAGLYIEMDPDTFELSAWEAANHGRDMTGASWGADVVRLQVSSDGDRDTGNIKSDARRAIAARIKRSAVLAGGSDDTYGLATASGTPIPWHGFYSSDAEDTAALEQIAATQVKAHNDAGDTVRARFKLGHDLANGKYLPFEDVLCDDIASLHSGSSKWDWNEATAPVAALTISLRPAGDWDAFADLGSAYMSSGERNFQTRISGRAQGPTLRLCDPSKDCAALTASDLTAGTATNGDVESGATNWSGGSVTTAMKHAGTNGYGVTSATSMDVSLDFGMQEFVGGTRYVLDVWLRLTGDHLESTITFGDAGGDQDSSTYAGVVGNDPVDLWDEVEVGADGSSWQRGRVCWTPSANRTNVRVRVQVTGNGAQDMAVDDVALYTTDADDLTGTSNRAARCDHGHRARDIAFSPGAVLSSTNVQDAIEEAATLGGVTDHGALTGLGDDDHPQYLLGSDGGKGTVNVVAASGASLTLDLADGNDHDVTLSADCTLTIDGATAGVSCYMTILLRQDATGSRTVTWPASVEWVGGTAPTLQTAATAWDSVVLFTYDGGTTWFAHHSGTASGSASSGDVGEQLVKNGASAPPVTLTNEDEDDWLYADVA